jgi:histidinol-phosphate aminotransferase
MMEILELVRKNILELEPYQSSRSEAEQPVKVFLDANENAFGSPLDKWYNRYPDHYHLELRTKISRIKNIPAENIVLGNGSDECIDLLMRIFCEPGKDHIIVCPPTFEMYKTFARMNDVMVREVPLTSAFQLDLAALEEAVDEHSKILFICTPNSPTGNIIDHEDIETILMNFPGIVVVDEAYINYSRSRSFISEIKNYPNLVVMQTFSKAWGLAGLRLGMALASVQVIRLFNKIRPPYNINTISQELVSKAIDRLDDVNAMILETVEFRKKLQEELLTIEFVTKVFQSESNFLLVQMENAGEVYRHLKANGILVSDKSRTKGCENCLRITVGNERENKLLLQTLKAFEKQ